MGVSNCNKSLVLYLYAAGYRHKLISIITGYCQGTVSKIIKNPAGYVPSIEGATQEQLCRKMVIDTIRACKPIKKFYTSAFDEQDKTYIRLLEYCMVDRMQIRQLYAEATQYRIRIAYREPKEFILKFDPQGLDILEEDWLLFIEQVKKYEKDFNNKI